MHFINTLSLTQDISDCFGFIFGVSRLCSLRFSYYYTQKCCCILLVFDTMCENHHQQIFVYMKLKYSLCLCNLWMTLRQLQCVARPLNRERQIHTYFSFLCPCASLWVFRDRTAAVSFRLFVSLDTGWFCRAEKKQATQTLEEAVYRGRRWAGLRGRSTEGGRFKRRPSCSPPRAILHTWLTASVQYVTQQRLLHGKRKERQWAASSCVNSSLSLSDVLPPRLTLPI